MYLREFFQSTVGSSLIFWRYIVVVYRGEKFSGYNKPKRTPKHPKKSHAVLAKKGDKIKLIRFGAQGADTNPPRKGESIADKAKRKCFTARHAKIIAKGKRVAAKMLKLMRMKLNSRMVNLLL